MTAQLTELTPLMRLCAQPNFMFNGKTTIFGPKKFEQFAYCEDCYRQNTSMPICPFYQMVETCAHEIGAKFCERPGTNTTGDPRFDSYYAKRYCYCIDDVEIVNIEIDEANSNKVIGVDQDFSFTFVLEDGRHIENTIKIPELFKCNICGNAHKNDDVHPTVKIEDDFKLFLGENDKLWDGLDDKN
jgi:hypothetical protein